METSRTSPIPSGLMLTAGASATRETCGPVPRPQEQAPPTVQDGVVFSTGRAPLLPQDDAQRTSRVPSSTEGAPPVTFGPLEALAVDALPQQAPSVSPTAAVDAASAPGVTQPSSTAKDEIYLRSKTEARTGYFHYRLQDGKIQLKWDPVLPDHPFTLPSGEQLTDEQARQLVTDVPGPYTFAYDRPHNELVVTLKPGARDMAFDLVNGRLTPADPEKAREWHPHNGTGGPELPEGESIVEMQVAGEFIQVRTSANRMFSYDPTKPDPVEWKAQSGCPFGGEVHLPEGIRDWTFGQSVSAKPWRVCINAMNPWTDINSYYEDAHGRKGAFGFTATTGVLMGSGREVRYRDTGLPADFMRGFLTPHRGQFQAEKLAQAGSTWMVYGHEPDGTPGLYARMYDYEMNGDCPIKRYTYDDLPFDRDHVYGLNDMVQRLPVAGWNHIPFPTLAGQAQVTDRIDILTTGPGDAQREVRLEGRGPDGATGFYHKAVTDQDWQFTATGQPLTGNPVPVGQADPAKATTTPIAWSYDQAKWHGTLADAPLRNIELLNFHPYQAQDEASTIRFTLESGQTIDVLARTGDGYTMFKAREVDTELAGQGVGLQKVLTGTLDIPQDVLASTDPTVKDFVDTYLAPLNHRENSLMVLAEDDEVRVFTKWFHRNSDERFDWSRNPPLDVTFTRDATGQTAYEKRALDPSLRPAESMSDDELTGVIASNKGLESTLTHDVNARQRHHRLTWIRTQAASTVMTAAAWTMSALNLTRSKDLLAMVSEIGPPLMAAHAKADWHSAWTTPAGYERAVATLQQNVADAEALLERRQAAP